MANRPRYLGFRYEDNIFLHFAIKCAREPTIKDFRIKSNADSDIFGALDDVVLDVEYHDGSIELYVVQVKHGYNKETPEYDNEDDDGDGNSSSSDSVVEFEYENSKQSVETQDDFNEIKLEFDYSNIMGKYNTLKESYPLHDIIIVLYTNFHIKHINDHEDYEETNYEAKRLLKLFRTNNNGKIFKNKNNRKVNISKDLKRPFKEKTWLLTGETESLKYMEFISEDFDHAIPTNEIYAIVKQFEDGNLVFKKNEWFTKFDVIAVLTELILHPYVIAEKKLDEHVGNCDCILETFCHFNVSVVTNKHNLVINHCIAKFIEQHFNLHENFSWRDNLDKTILKDDLNRIPLLIKARLTHKDLIYILWRNGSIPLSIRYTEESKPQVDFVLNNFLVSISVILVTDLKQHLIPSNATTFHSLRELPRNLQKKNLERMKISFQDKGEISLKEVLDSDYDSCLSHITPNVYLQLITKCFALKKQFEQDALYIPRVLTTFAFTPNIANSHFFTIRDDACSSINLSVYDKNVHKRVNTIYTDLSPNETLSVIEKKKLDPYLCLKKYEENYICYATNESRENLKHHQVKVSVSEEYLMAAKFPFTVIFGNSGQGKTTFLASIEKNLPKDHWSLKINLYDQGYLFENNFRIQDLIQIQLQNSDSEFLNFTNSLFIYQIKKNKVILLVDGYDESDIEGNSIISIQNKIKVPMFLAIRSTKVVLFNNISSTPFYKLRKLSIEDQKTLFAKSSIDFNKLQLTVRKNFLGVPLLSKLLIRAPQENDINIIKLYQNYIDSLSKYSNNDKRLVQKMAISGFFKRQFLKELELWNFTEYDEDFVEFKQNHKKDLIISGFTPDNKVIFIHPTFKEFLCAQFLVQQIQTTPEQKRYQLILKRLFVEDLVQIRYFFDLMLAQTNELHLAVLTNDFSKFEILCDHEELTNSKDSLGRNALHLAMGYGERILYPSEITGVSDFKKISRYNGIIKFKQFLIHENILSKLLHCTKNEHEEDLLGNRPYEYSLLSHSFYNLNKFCHYYQIDKLHGFYRKICFVYLSVYLNLTYLFQQIIPLYPLVNFGNMTMLKLNALSEYADYSTNFAFRSVKEMHLLMWDGNLTLLHLACQKDYSDIVKILITHGLIPFKTKCGYGQTVQNYIFNNGSMKTAKLLQDSGFISSKVYRLTLKNKIRLDIITKIKNAKFEDIQWALYLYTNNKGIIDNELFFTAVEASKPEILDLLAKQYHAHLFKILKFGRNLLHWAAENSNLNIVKTLIDSYKFNIECVGHNYYTPLFFAVYNSNVSVVRFLLDKGANVNHVGFNGVKLVHILGNATIEVAEMLFDRYNLNVNDYDTFHFTPLIYAAMFGNLDMMSFLINKGANIRFRHFLVGSVMHVAAITGSIEMMQLLYNADDQALTVPFQMTHLDFVNILTEFMGKTENYISTINWLTEHGVEHSGIFIFLKKSKLLPLIILFLKGVYFLRQSQVFEIFLSNFFIYVALYCIIYILGSIFY